MPNNMLEQFNQLLDYIHHRSTSYLCAFPKHRHQAQQLVFEHSFEVVTTCLRWTIGNDIDGKSLTVHQLVLYIQAYLSMSMLKVNAK